MPRDATPLPARLQQLQVRFLFTFNSLKDWLKQPSAVNNRSNQNLLCFDAIDYAIAVDETLPNRRVSDLRDNSTNFRKIGNRLCRFNYL